MEPIKEIKQAKVDSPKESQKTQAVKTVKYKKTKEEKLIWYGSVGRWFQTMCFMNIPIFGFFYMLVKALKKNTPTEKKSFATAYVLYRVLVMILALTILFVIYKVGLSFVDEILKYAGN